jgi:hypothetical protein
VGIERYFDDLERAERFYIETIGLEISDEQVGSLTVASVLSALSKRGLSRLHRKTRPRSSLRFTTRGQQSQPSVRMGWFSLNLHGPWSTVPKVQRITTSGSD